MPGQSRWPAGFNPNAVSGRQIEAVELAIGRHFGVEVKAGSAAALTSTLIRELKAATEFDAADATLK